MYAWTKSWKNIFKGNFLGAPKEMKRTKRLFDVVLLFK